MRRGGAWSGPAAGNLIAVLSCAVKHLRFLQAEFCRRAAARLQRTAASNSPPPMRAGLNVKLLKKPCLRFLPCLALLGFGCSSIIKGDWFSYVLPPD